MYYVSKYISLCSDFNVMKLLHRNDYYLYIYNSSDHLVNDRIILNIRNILKNK